MMSATQQSVPMTKEASWSFISRAQQVMQAVEDSVAPQREAGMAGFSGDKLIASLSSLLALHDGPSSVYLELGVFRGLTLVSTAMRNRERACFGIDNFAQFDPQGVNRSIVEELIKNRDLSNARIIDRDYESAFAELSNYIGSRSVALYFVDGPHDYRSQVMSLLLARPYLGESAVIVVDDSNYLHVRQANRDFLAAFSDWKLLCEAYTECHPQNMSSAQRCAAERGWWNGVNVMVHDPYDQLPRRYPSAPGGSELLQQEHLLLSSKSVNFLPLIGDMVNAVRAGSARGIAASALRAYRIHRKQSELRPTFDTLNTFSDGLPSFRLAT
jgi:hypothetical protein